MTDSSSASKKKQSSTTMMNDNNTTTSDRQQATLALSPNIYHSTTPPSQSFRGTGAHVGTTTTTTTTTTTPTMTRSTSFSYYDVTNTMNRLRSSMVGTTSAYNRKLQQESSLSLHNPQQQQQLFYDCLDHEEETSCFPLAAATVGGDSLLPISNPTARATTMTAARDALTKKNTTTCPNDNVVGDEEEANLLKEGQQPAKRKPTSSSILAFALGQIPAILVIAIFHLMIGIPFGVSYFPIDWKEQFDFPGSDSTNGTIVGDGLEFSDLPFPVVGKEALGIRMFLFSTFLGQIVFTLTSGFVNPIGLQMVENVPYCHTLANLALRHFQSTLIMALQQEGGVDENHQRDFNHLALSVLATTMVLFSLSSLIVGLVFWILGYWNLGRIVYYFPNHVLIGLIAGIGVYLARTGMEVTMDQSLSLSALARHWDAVCVVLLYEIVLRILERLTRDANGKQRYSLLSPIYFCMVTPIFYLVLYIFSIPLQDAIDAGYFFPALSSTVDTVNDSMAATIEQEEGSSLWAMWEIIDFSLVSWPTIAGSIPTLISLTFFSLIHVPINIPAFALSTQVEIDMDQELVSHGIANLLSGCLGGLPNYMAYTQSVLYDKSGGTGIGSGIVVALVTALLFAWGPDIASFIPRCMAGTLLLHVGIDLFLEGVYDSYPKLDPLEYASVWIITVVMTLYGMDSAMITGVLTAIFTFVAQNMTYVEPVRGTMSAATLRSDVWNRNHEARAILESADLGRPRILVVQCQGHLFFGNMAHFVQRIHQLLEDRWQTPDQPLIVILDFALVVGIDSSAAQSITKLKTKMKDHFHVELSIFVTGSKHGFPCEYNLSQELCAPLLSTHDAPESDDDSRTPASSSSAASLRDTGVADERTNLLSTTTSDEKEVVDQQQGPNQEVGGAVSRVSSHEAVEQVRFSGSHVCDDLNLALIHAENYLIARQDPSLLERDLHPHHGGLGFHAYASSPHSSHEDDERKLGLQYLLNLCPHPVDPNDVAILFSKFQREVYHEHDFIWRQGSTSDCVKLLIKGKLIALLENEAGTWETIDYGNTIGELGLVEGIARMSSVQCLTNQAVLYSLSRTAYESELPPSIARLVDRICVRYLSARVQHVSNRIYETRCLPI